jgi:uncharacterized protein
VKWILFILGWISFVLGIIGAFLPILPTTPFLILTAFLFSKSSPKFHAWLLTLPIAGDGIRDWNENQVIRPRAKVLCVSMIGLSLGVIWAFVDVIIVVKILITIVLVFVSTFVVTRKGRIG